MQSSSRLPPILRMLEQVRREKKVVILRSDAEVEGFLNSLRG